VRHWETAVEREDLPITFEGDEPLTTPSEACRLVYSVAIAAGIVIALGVVFAAPCITRLLTN